ncbi:MAG: alpha/beta hydrolase [Nitriliruptorales bacterium]|nr:alpha/beta hydrolase [Nitriliruptorales bacterium]
MPFVTSNGIQIRYEVTGAGSTVLLHHGGGLRLESWTEAGWLPTLARNHRVVTFDARGHGESGKPTDPADYALERMVGDVLAVADASDTERFHLLGWSMGAKVAWGVADQAQDRLASVAMIGADPEASDDSAGQMIDLLRQGLETVTSALSQMWDVPAWALEQYRQNDPQALLAYFQSDWPDLSHVPDQLEAPSLLVCGDDDEVYDAMARAAMGRDHLGLITLEGHDHMSSLTSTQAQGAYEEFLNEVS